MKVKISLLLLGLFAASAFFFSGCSENEKPQKTQKTKSQNGPKFRKDGDVWLVKNETGDTLMHFDAEYAISPTDQNYGMMFRKSMDENMSMLFFRDRYEMQSFWMKNTYVSLDIIYIDDKQRIVNIQKNATPLSTESLPSTGPALFVLEIKGGISDKIGLTSGDILFYKDLEK